MKDLPYANCIETLGDDWRLGPFDIQPWEGRGQSIPYNATKVVIPTPQNLWQRIPSIQWHTPNELPKFFHGDHWRLTIGSHDSFLEQSRTTTSVPAEKCTAWIYALFVVFWSSEGKDPAHRGNMPKASRKMSHIFLRTGYWTYYNPASSRKDRQTHFRRFLHSHTTTLWLPDWSLFSLSHGGTVVEEKYGIGGPRNRGISRSTKVSLERYGSWDKQHPNPI